MLNNKIKYILALFIILLLSMNAFSATNFTDDSSDATLQSSSSDKVVVDTADDTDSADDDGDGTYSQVNKENDNSDNTNTDDSKLSEGTSGGSGSGFSFGNGSSFGGNGSSFGGNGSGFSFGNGSSFGGNGSGFSFGNSTFGGNGSSFDIASLLDYFTKMMGGDNATNTTNATNKTVNPEVSDVPKVVTSTSYAPVSQSPTVEKQSSHVIQRLRDNKAISEGNALTLGTLNKVFDSDFTNGHLLVYVDGKLVFNEITAGDLSTPIFQITDDYIGQHQIKVEFTANGNSNTNTYTEDVLII